MSPQHPAPPPAPECQPARQRVDVVVHTHWDREWYMDRETTLARLEVVMARVAADLDAGRLQHFLFDGQTVAFEDLATRAPIPLMESLTAHAKAGRLVLGPWYVASAATAVPFAPAAITPAALAKAHLARLRGVAALACHRARAAAAIA